MIFTENNQRVFAIHMLQRQGGVTLRTTLACVCVCVCVLVSYYLNVLLCCLSKTIQLNAYKKQSLKEKQKTLRLIKLFN